MLGSVYVDFDGTIAPSDPTDTLLSAFAIRPGAASSVSGRRADARPATAWPNRSIC